MVLKYVVLKNKKGVTFGRQSGDNKFQYQFHNSV